MNIKELNERIEQLTKLVISADETIKNAKEMIVLAEQERDRLADQRREQEPKFERVHQTKSYWRLAFDNAFGCGTWVLKQVERGEYDFNNMTDFKGNNYFHTEKRAQEVADKINFLLKLERLHDIYCPDYVPDWNKRDETRYFIYFNVTDKRYSSCYSLYAQGICGVYFPSKEIAQKVCDILNEELEEKK